MNLADIIPGWTIPRKDTDVCLIGVLPGEGIGPEIISVALDVLEAAASRTNLRVKIEKGGKIGLEAAREKGTAFPPEVAEFCRSIFDRGGSILSGPGGGRFVYDLRSRFDLFCKLVPVRPLAPLLHVGPIKAERKNRVDILIVRENTGGIYFGRWNEASAGNMCVASHEFEYREDEVERIVRVACELARRRKRHLTLVLKSEGIPAISRLWLKVAGGAAAESGIALNVLQADHGAFQLVQEPECFDVLVTSNFIGDIFADLAGLFLGSRALLFSGNFGLDGKAVYQTGHGCAHDIKGLDVANPIGQILSLVMMLRTSFGAHPTADCIHKAIKFTLSEGWKTADLAEPGERSVGTREVGRQIVRAIEGHLAEDED